MKHKVSELEVALLDAAVALAEGYVIRESKTGERWVETADQSEEGGLIGYLDGVHVPEWAPSSCWQDGGPIIERERLCPAWDGEGFRCTTDAGTFYGGPSMLVAGLRAFVAAKVGDEVELP